VRAPGLRLKHVARVEAGQSPPSPDVTKFDGEGMPFLQGNAEFGARYPKAVHRCDLAPRIASEGALLVSVRAPVGAVNTADQRYGIGRGLAAVNPRSIHPRYAYWLLLHSAAWLNSIATGSTFTAISGGDLGDVPVPVAGQIEQRKIADHLDRETAQIDAFIAKNEELIALLTERRAAVVTNAVLRGLDPMTDLQDSSVEWLGAVPSHWRVSRLSRWFSVTLGKMLDEAKFASTAGDVLPYVRASNIKVERLDLSDVKSMPFTMSEQAKFSLRTGDLVVVEGGSIGVNAPVEEDMHGWGFQKTVNRVRAIGGDLPRFLGYQLDVIREAGVLNMITNVSTIQHLTAEKLERIIVAMPPVPEQREIVSYIAHSTSVIDRAIETAREGVRLARERRAALISAAVTGNIDVREAA
jgi:type I restriction enzyme S subunit